MRVLGAVGSRVSEQEKQRGNNGVVHLGGFECMRSWDAEIERYGGEMMRRKSKVVSRMQ